MGLKDKCLYVGEFQHNLDVKNRLTIPSKWRFNGDNDEVYLALPNPVGCISVYPPKMVAKLEEKVQEVSLGDKKSQRALTRLFSKADHFGCDKNGRIVLSENLIKHASIDKEAMLVGNFITFNLWSPSLYEAYLNNEEEDQEDEMSQILTQLGV
jgi:MraZ protein